MVTATFVLATNEMMKICSKPQQPGCNTLALNPDAEKCERSMEIKETTQNRKFEVTTQNRNHIINGLSENNSKIHKTEVMKEFKAPPLRKRKSKLKTVLNKMLINL